MVTCIGMSGECVGLEYTFRPVAEGHGPVLLTHAILGVVNRVEADIAARWVLVTARCKQGYFLGLTKG